jgi:hypothetical protein
LPIFFCLNVSLSTAQDFLGSICWVKLKNWNTVSEYETFRKKLLIDDTIISYPDDTLVERETFAHSSR